MEFSSRANPGRHNAQKKYETKLEYEPTERQKKFHACGADVVLYGGAAGGGKSIALLMDAWETLRKTPGGYGVLFRKSFPELERSLILTSRRLFPRGIAKYNEMSHRWSIRPYAKGPDSILDFAHAKNRQEAEDLYKSAEFLFLGIDEATLNEWEVITFLFSRSRTSIPGALPRVVMGTNPGGIGHLAIKQYFGIGKPDEEGYVAPETTFTPEPTEEDPFPLSRCFIPAKLDDNPFLATNDPAYIKKLSLLPINTRKMLRDGDWDVFEGKFFQDFTDRHIIPPFDIPKHWKIYRSIDYGYTAPFCCLWFASSPDGHYYLFREIYQRGLRDVEQAIVVRDASIEPVEYTIGDPSMRNKNASGRSPLENYMSAANIAVFPGDNNRVFGWMSCRNMLALHADGTPIFKVFNTCANFIKEAKSAVFDDKTVDDITIHSKNDHAIDAWRYFAMGRVVVPENPKTDPYVNLDDMSKREWVQVNKMQDGIRDGQNRATLHELNREDEWDGGLW